MVLVPPDFFGRSKSSYWVDAALAASNKNWGVTPSLLPISSIVSFES